MSRRLNHRSLKGSSSAAALAAAVILMFSTSAHPCGAAVTAGVGADHFSGPNQTTQDVMGFVITGWKGGEATFAAAAYTNSVLGTGLSGTAALSVPAGSTTLAQLMLSRTLGEDGYRALRLQAGPVLALGAGRTLGLFYTHADESIGPSSNGLSSEITVPVSQRVTTIGRGSLASVSGGGTNAQGAAGLIWAAGSHVVLVSELGFGRDVAGLSSGGTRTAPLGAGSREGQDYVSGAALLVGIRYLLH